MTHHFNALPLLVIVAIIVGPMVLRALKGGRTSETVVSRSTRTESTARANFAELARLARELEGTDSENATALISQVLGAVAERGEAPSSISAVSRIVGTDADAARATLATASTAATPERYRRETLAQSENNAHNAAALERVLGKKHRHPSQSAPTPPPRRRPALGAVLDALEPLPPLGARKAHGARAPLAVLAVRAPMGS